MFGQARSRSVLMGLDNHMITSTVPVLLSRAPCRTTDMTPRHSRDRQTGLIPITQCPWRQPLAGATRCGRRHTGPGGVKADGALPCGATRGCGRRGRVRAGAAGPRAGHGVRVRSVEPPAGRCPSSPCWRDGHGESPAPRRCRHARLVLGSGPSGVSGHRVTVRRDSRAPGTVWR